MRQRIRGSFLFSRDRHWSAAFLVLQSIVPQVQHSVEPSKDLFVVAHDDHGHILLVRNAPQQVPKVAIESFCCGRCNLRCALCAGLPRIGSKVEEIRMKKSVFAILTLAIADFLALSAATVAPAEAAACVRGARGAACAGPRGAVAVRRAPVVVAPVYRAPVRRGVVVVR